tara:strand:- start:234 stop:479 length:246 start_codon:yes stop_codon:yes gene_type:complete
MSLAKKAKSLEKNTKTPLLARLSDSQRKELFALREDYRRGELRHVTKKALADLVRDEFQMETLSPQTLGAFLNEPEKKGGK